MTEWTDLLQNCDNPYSIEEVSVGDRVQLHYSSGFGYLVLMSVEQINERERTLTLSFVGLFDWHNKFQINSSDLLSEIQQLRRVELPIRKIHKIVKMPEDKAVRMVSDIAIDYINRNFGSDIRDVYLEGIDWSEETRSWKITVGFTRKEIIEKSINPTRAALLGPTTGWVRRYKQVEVSSLTGEATSVTFDPEDHDQ